MWEAGGYLASLGSKSKLAAILFTIKNNHPLRMVMNSFNHIYIDFLVRCLFEKVCDNSTNSLFFKLIA